MLQKSVDRGKDLKIKLFEEISTSEFDAAEYENYSFAECYKLDSGANVFDASFDLDTVTYENCEPFVVWSLDS